MHGVEKHLLARLRFRHLQLIAEVERTGSLSRAADALSLTQPALSKALKEVEGMMGFEIFHRGTRGLQKTAQGAVVVNGAVAEISGLISQYRAHHPGLGVLLTGGDAALLAARLPARIFVIPELVLLGLNRILAYHVEK